MRRSVGADRALDERVSAGVSVGEGAIEFDAALAVGPLGRPGLGPSGALLRRPQEPVAVRPIVANEQATNLRPQHLVAAAFPSCPPYGGQVAEVIPHLTIGDGAPRTELEAAEAEVRPYLPIEAEAASVTLMTGPPPGSAPTAARWKTVATFSLA